LNFLLNPNFQLSPVPYNPIASSTKTEFEIGKIKFDISSDGAITYFNGNKIMLSAQLGQIFHFSESIPTELPSFNGSIHDLPPPEEGNEHTVTSSDGLDSPTNQPIKPYYISQSFKVSNNQGLFGLGQHRDGILNWRNCEIQLCQYNTNISVPIILSTEGYGIIWENLGESVYRQQKDEMSFFSNRADGIHYWIIAGKSFDEIIAGYRTMTGAAPLFPKWGYGFIQSRNRYWTRQEVMDVVARHRELRLPIDVIVIDYVYYGRHEVGSHRFDEDFFPNPQSMIEEFHDKYKVKLLLSIWPTISDKADTYSEFKSKGFLLNCMACGATFYDALNDKAGKAFWRIIESRLLSLGVDAWWLDASEPENLTQYRKIRTALGDARSFANIYSLQHTKHLFEGQKSVKPNARVFILTRSSFIGQQRNAAAAWSGDIPTTFEELRLQIMAGLNFCACGLPYWCTDIGGYKGGWAKSPLYRELFIRWFQFGTFCPILRSHGRRFPRNRKGLNEIWAYGNRAMNIIRNFLDLRYRLMPYIYTLGWKITSEGYTMMRLLAFDYPDDSNTYSITDQFLFGPSLMICPITTRFQRSRLVYLPAGEWFNFWTGKKHQGSQIIQTPAPIKQIPIFLKAGTILPMGPMLQYTHEIPVELQEYELRIYVGADGAQTLFFDDGTSMDYEKKKYLEIQFIWENSPKRLIWRIIHNQFLPTNTTLKFKYLTVSESQGTGIYSTNLDKKKPPQLLEISLSIERGSLELKEQ
jgi:alpha-D-xyloside xylohydrolase